MIMMMDSNTPPQAPTAQLPQSSQTTTGISNSPPPSHDIDDLHRRHVDHHHHHHHHHEALSSPSSTSSLSPIRQQQQSMAATERHIPNDSLNSANNPDSTNLTINNQPPQTSTDSSTNDTLTNNSNSNNSDLASRLAKILSALQGAIGASVQDEAIAQQSQLLVAMAATMAAAATGNDSLALQQEQLLANMAPTLINMVNSNLNQNNNKKSSNTTMANANTIGGSVDSQSVLSSNEGDDGSRSKKRRKQSKPVRYESHVSTLLPFDDKSSTATGNAASADDPSTLSSLMSQSHISSMDTDDNVMLSKQQQHNSTTTVNNDNTLNSKEKSSTFSEEQPPSTQIKQRQMQQETSSDGDEDLEENNGGRCSFEFDDVDEDAENNQSSRLIDEVEDGGAPSTIDAAENESSTSAAAEMMMTREKQLLLQQIGMFANWQQKLLQPCICPQCNSQFANEDQLRAHIDLEHMHKLPSFSITPVSTGSTSVPANDKNHHQSTELNDHMSTVHKRSKRKRSPSSRSISSSNSSNEDEECSSSIGDRKSPYESNPTTTTTTTETEPTKSSSSPGNNSQQQQQQLFRSKDLNHNLLGLNLPPNILNPLISSLATSNSKSTSSSSSQQTPQRQTSSPSSSLPPQPVTSPSPKISATTSQQQQNESSSSTSCQSPAVINQNQQQSQQQSQVQQQQQHQTSAPSLFHNSMAPFFFPHMFTGNGSNPQFQSPSAMINGVPVPTHVAGPRIFNPEAYCELCNKEFCNKYFLKTHKANKHNIYTMDGASTNQQSSGPTSAGQNATMNNTNSSMSPYLSTSSSAMMMTNSVVGSQTGKLLTGTGEQQNALLNGTNGQQQSTQQPGPFQPPLRLHLNMNMINLDSYCEVCQKEFCNKYFLKKHKQKIHGFVYQGDTAIPPSQNSPQMQQLQQLQMLHQHLAAQHHQQQQQMNSNQSPTRSSSTGNNGANESTTPTDKMNSNNSATGPSPSPSGLSSLVINDKSLLMNASSVTSATSNADGNATVSMPSYPNSQIILTPDRLRQMGVINTEAFCEICCKEFCNKYFLRTHKINKHRIVDGQPTSNKFNNQIHPQLAGQFLTQQMLANNFSNMFAGASLTDDSQLEPGQRDPASYGKNGSDFLNGFAAAAAAAAAASNNTENNSENIVKCELCPQQFPNNHLLKMHKFYSHGIPYTKQDEDEQHRDESNSASVKKESDSDLKTDETSDNAKPKPTTTATNNEDSNDFVDSETEQETSSIASSAALSAQLMVTAELNQSEQSSQDLQKLHSMIKELDGSVPVHPVIVDEDNVNNNNKTDSANDGDKCFCHLCKVQCENRYFLRAHLINEHGLPQTEEAFQQLTDQLTMKTLIEQQKTAMFGTNSPESSANATNSSSEAFCDICNKEFCSKYFLKTHKQNIHGIYDSNSNDGQPPPPPPSSSSSSTTTTNTNAQPNQQQQQSPAQQQPSSGPPQSLLPPALLNSLYQRAKTPADLESLNLALSQAIGVHAKSSPTNSSMINHQVNNTNLTNSQLNSNNNNNNNNKMVNNLNSSNSTLAATIKAAMAAGLVPGAMGDPQKARMGPMITGRNYCNICNKELCNKYFMKTHMLKMHGINIDEHPIEAASTSTIGGVTCDICQKELCSKYFLKVHKQNTHGIYEDGTAPVLLGSTFSATQQQQAKLMSQVAANMMNNGQTDINPLLLMSMANSTNDSNSAASDTNSVGSVNSEKEQHHQHEHGVNDTTNRTPGQYQEVCQICDRRFKSIKWLKAHMLNDHGELLAIMHRNDMTQLASLDPSGRLCFICGQTFTDRLAMQVHLMKEHKTTQEEVAMNLAGNLKMAAMMAAAAAVSVDPNAATNVADLSANNSTTEEVGTKSPPQSIPSSPYPPSSPKETTKDEDNRNGLPSNNPLALFQNPALQNLFLKNPGLLAAAAAAASSDGDGQLLSNQLLSMFGSISNSLDQKPTSSSRSESPSEMNTTPNTNKDAGSGKKYQCQYCNRSYRHSHSLHRHMISHKLPNSTNLPNQLPESISDSKPPTPSNGASDGQTSDNKPRNKRYRCSKCNKKFRTRDLCLVHIRALHSNQMKPSSIKCSYCQATFANTAQLKLHINQTHHQPFEDNEDNTEVPLNLHTGDQHTLPPSPSASGSEDEVMIAAANAAAAAAKHLFREPLNDVDMAMDGIEPDEEDGTTEDNDDEDDHEQPISTPASTSGDTTAANISSHNNPSLICVNGSEQF